MLGPHKAGLLGVLMDIWRDYLRGRRVSRQFSLILASLDLLRTNKRYKCLKQLAFKNQRPKSPQQLVEINHRRLHFLESAGNEKTGNRQAGVSLREHQNRAAVSINR
jgi:hypothetical protein